MNLLAVVAFVLFVITAVLAFLVDSVGLDVLVGLTASGLAAWVASGLFPTANIPPRG